MRQIFLDTETTGLEHRLGHRVIEIGCVEMKNRQLTGQHFHRYLNPDREIDVGAQAVHGISLDFLQDKPRFADIAAEFIDFIRGAELIIHNAPFDLGFLNAELALLNMAPVSTFCHGTVDTLLMARALSPGKKNNLDALCSRHGIDNSQRTLHGALLDAEILAEVYIAMTRGQESLDMDIGIDHIDAESTPQPIASLAHTAARIIYPNADELNAHHELLERIQKESKWQCLWLSGDER